ncbi:MAG TPA: hypothetical protein RMH99_08340 [Sandaracinaceae bacterium LLY-WYZ-13_1]|nr:hypothetical protein [Sandaracinaceae bacterium LLY-WYZ-13_1]
MRLPLRGLSVLGLAAVACAGASASPRPATAPPPAASRDATPATEPEPEATARPRVDRTEAAPSAVHEPPCRWRIEDGALTHPDVGEDEPPTLTSVDLDGDPPADRIARLGGCGNWGECRFVVLRACGAARFRAVWGPAYAMAVEVGARDPGDSLAPLILHGRTARAGCDLPTRAVLRRVEGEWRGGPVCAGVGAWDDAVCGEPPPPCASPEPTDEGSEAGGGR